MKNKNKILQNRSFPNKIILINRDSSNLIKHRYKIKFMKLMRLNKISIFFSSKLLDEFIYALLMIIFRFLSFLTQLLLCDPLIEIIFVKLKNP